jgi:hypothetical protein
MHRDRVHMLSRFGNYKPTNDCRAIIKCDHEIQFKQNTQLKFFSNNDARSIKSTTLLFGATNHA